MPWAWILPASRPDWVANNMETRDPHLTHWRVIDTFRLREGRVDDWRVTSHKMVFRVAAKRYGGPTYELVDKTREAIPSWRRLLRYFSGSLPDAAAETTPSRPRI